MIKRLKTSFFLFAAIMLSLTTLCFGQFVKKYGVPAIKNYTTEDYNFDPQNWEVLQDERGIMFFGNTKGLLVFDGTGWRTYKPSNKTAIRSLTRAKDGKIYYGAQGDFGYLSIDSNKVGILELHSLIHLLPAYHRNFRDVWAIVSTPDAIIFETTNKIIQLKNNGRLKIYNSQAGFHVAFYVDSIFYVREWGRGILYLPNDSLKLIPDGEMFANERVYSILPYERNEITGEAEKLLIFSQNLGAFIYDKKGIKKWNIPADKILIKSRVYNGITISTELFAFGTGQNGLITINKNGELLKVINKDAGLQSNGVNKIYLDKNKNLWLALDNGISYLEINSPFSFYNEELSNLPNKQIVSEIHYNNLYVATEQGIYYKKWKAKNAIYQSNQFKLLKNSEGQTWAFRKINGVLYACHNPGLYLIQNGSAKLHSIPYTNVWRIMQLKKNPKLVLAGTSKGFELFETGDILKWKKVIKGFQHAARYFTEDSKGNIWVSNSLKGVYKFKFNEEYDSLLVLGFYNSNNGLPSNVGNLVVENKFNVLVENENGLYLFDTVENRFSEYIQFTKHINEFRDFDLFDSDENGNLYFVNNGQAGRMIRQPDGEYNYINDTYDKFQNLKILQVDQYNDSTIFIETNKEFIHYNPKISTETDYQYSSIIRKVEIISTDSLLFFGNFTDENGKFILSPTIKKHIGLSFKHNSLRFNYTALFYQDNDKTKYSVKLEGFDHNWTDWAIETKKEYINVPVGDFVFKVKAKNIYQKESDTALFSFIILPPWYRTKAAFFIYAILIVIMVRIIIVLYTRRLKLANIKLEQTVKKRTVEIEQQKEEIQTQAEHLSITNKELEKLSIVASETNNGVMIMDADCNFEWVNEGFTNMLGYTLEELKSEKGTNLRETSFYPKINDKLNYLKTKRKTVIYEAQNITKKGRKIWVQTTITPIIGSQGEIIKLIAIDSDVTQLKKAEREIIKQRDEIFHQKKEITDSLIYSKHIQNAILPSKENITSIIPHSFVFNKPKEIISGDFNWLSKIDDLIIIAVADCTGHGVPGALMSMLGITFLNEIVNNRGITGPAEILNRLRNRIIQMLHQDNKDESSQDGMDMAICVFNLTSGKMKYAGANHPILICRENDFKELLPDKMPIRQHFYNETSFTEQEIIFTEKDNFYMFSDGFADQFGGPKGKKYLNNNFKMFLNSLSELNIEDRLAKLEQEFNDWKGSLEQVDDVMVLGLKIYRNQMISSINNSHTG